MKLTFAVTLTYQFTELISLASVTRFTSASHYTKRKFIFDVTSGISGTGPNFQARVETFPIALLDKACLLAWTISICCAANIWFRN